MDPFHCTASARRFAICIFYIPKNELFKKKAIPVSRLKKRIHHKKNLAIRCDEIPLVIHCICFS